MARRRAEDLKVISGTGGDLAEGARSDSARQDAELFVSPETGERYIFSDQVGHLLRKAYQRHVAIFQDLSVESQLTSVQFAVLCALAESGPASLTEIGRMTAIDPATMRGIVQRLKTRELVNVLADPSDGRKLLLVLTDEGRDLIRRMVPNSFKITEATLNGLNIAEQTALVFLLKKLIDSAQ